jgi:CheY-like chemotaxis protein
MSGAKPPLPCCLVVEDQALIGMALEASLEEQGFQIAGPFARVCDALKWLKEHTPDIALLDLVLGDGPCTQLATTLRSRGVPFAIYSGVRPPAIRPLWGGAPRGQAGRVRRHREGGPGGRRGRH